MITAYWNGMKWECGAKQISYLEGLSTSYAIETQTNADKEGNAPTETVGMQDQEIALSTTYRIETGTRDIKAMIAKWKTLVGKAAPLIVGNQVFGPDKVQLQSVSVSNISVRPNGVFSAVSLSFKFKEFKPEVTKATSTKKAVSTAGTATAVNVGATPSDKASKKTVVTTFKDEQIRDR